MGFGLSAAVSSDAKKENIDDLSAIRQDRYGKIYYLD
jgi:hypothetical protein